MIFDADGGFPMSHPSPIAELNRRFGIPGVAEVVEGNGGLAKVHVNAAEAAGDVYLHGAHVTSWVPWAGAEVLFLSSRSQWQDGRAIRGGVPVCFPWFANRADDPGAPAHGFVRTKAWRLESVAHDAGAVTVTLATKSDESTKKWWPGDFRLAYHATFGPELTLELAVTNTGAAPLRFEEALHSYLRVGHIDRVRLQGLDGVHYLDKTDANRDKLQSGTVAVIAETDRVFLNTRQTVRVEDEGLDRRLVVAKENSLTTVVWNPWAQKAKAMSDLGDAEWAQMVCVETCNVAAFAALVAPGQQHCMKSVVKVEKL
jgi:glucose-6-phosphate 1-epimerase